MGIIDNLNFCFNSSKIQASSCLCVKNLSYREGKVFHFHSLLKKNTYLPSGLCVIIGSQPTRCLFSVISKHLHQT